MKLNLYDLQFVLRRLPKSVLEAMQASPGKVFLAGGFIRSVIANEEINDVDLFATDAKEAGSLAMVLAEQDPKRIHSTDNAFTIRGIKPAVQIIHRWSFATPEECAESFDFTIAKAAVYWHEEKRWESICHPDYYADLAAKRLVYTSPVRNEEAGGSLLRILKFYQRGYRIPLGSLGAVIARALQGVPAINWAKRDTMDAKEWETQIAHVITGLLREVDPQIDSEHLAHLPELDSAATESQPDSL